MPYQKYDETVEERMKKSERIRYRLGDKVVTSIVHGNNTGYMDAGTEVTITAVLDGHGYDITDNAGNCIRNIGWVV